MAERSPVFLLDFRDTAGCYERVADWLMRGANAPDHPFHWFGLATVTDRGEPDARTVILRGFVAEEHCLAFHTDYRAPKVEQLRAHPRVSLLFYDAEARLQVRAEADVTLHHEDGKAAAAWGSAHDGSRALYAVSHESGEVIDADDPVTPPPPPAMDDDAAFAHFVVAACDLRSLDVLELCSGGQRRVRFTWPRGELMMERLAP